MTDRPVAGLESTTRSRAWTARDALLAYLATWLIVGAISLAVWLASGRVLPRGVGTLSVDAAWLLVLLLLLLRRSRGVGLFDLGLRRPRGRWAVGLAVLTLFGYGLFVGVWDKAVNVGHIRSPFAGAFRTSDATIVLIGLGAVLSPILEEIFFRGFIYRALRNRLAVMPASILVGVMFGLVHTQYPLATLPDLAFYGVLLCLLYEYTDSILPGIALNLYLDVGGFLYALGARSPTSILLFLGLLLLLFVASSARRGDVRAA